MAQQARPHWYTQREYLRAVFKSLVSGWGTLPLSTRPISASDPTEDTFTPGVEESEGEDHDEDGHLDEAEDVVDLEADGPGEDEDGLDVEQHEQDREDVVADLALRPTVADRIDTRLVVEVLPGLRAGGADEAPETENSGHQAHGHTKEDDRCEVVAEEAGHRRGSLVKPFTGRQRPDFVCKSHSEGYRSVVPPVGFRVGSLGGGVDPRDGVGGRVGQGARQEPDE